MRKTIALLALAAFLPALSSAAPKIEVPELDWDFGKVPKAGSFSHPYWIKNVGDDTLRVSVKPG
jgi:hypothetical protein